MKKTIEIQTDILDENTKLGIEIRNHLNSHNVFAINVMASPGAGKTSVISKTIEKLKGKYRIAVIEGDIVPIDVDKLKKLNIPVVLAHTGGACHLDGVMIKQALNQLDLPNIDLLIIENVGNLVCPAEFYLGTHKNIVIASVPEGDDKPYKYPAMFHSANLVLLNKRNYLDKEPFDLDYFKKGVKLQNPNAAILPLSCRTNEGIDIWINWIAKNLKTKISPIGRVLNPPLH